MKNKLSFVQIMLWLFCVTFFVYQYGVRSAVPNVLNEELRNCFSISATQMGSLISLFYIAYTVMQIPVGVLIDRYNPKKIAIFAFACVSLGTIMFVATNSYIVAGISQLFLGFGCSFAFVLVMKIANDVFPKQKVALFSSIAISCGSLGPVIMSPLLAYLSQLYYWKHVVILFGSLGFLFSLSGAILLRKCEISGECEIDNSGLNITEALTEILSNSLYFFIGAFSMLMLGPVSAFCDAWGLTFVKNVYGLDKVHAASVVSMVYIGTIVGGPIVAYIAEKCNSYKKVMISGSVLLFMLISALLYIKFDIYSLYILLFSIGIVATSQFLAFPAAINMVDKKVGGTLTGVVNTITMLGCTIMAPSVGWCIDFFDTDGIYTAIDYKNGMIVLLVSVALAIIAASFIRDKKIG
ncbi:MAG: MFS transporter [Alphaproteobacteria bacterium]|nr:MFS transporter [Alphaproteobacteria bacterium]